MAMDPELIPSLVSFYQQAQCTKEIGYRLDLKRQYRVVSKLKESLGEAARNTKNLDVQIEELQTSLAQAHATSDVRQREIESLRSRHQNTDKADRAINETLKVQADSFKREINELRDDLKLRNEELDDLRQDALERDGDLKAARDVTRSRDKEMKEIRDQVRARESEIRKANHLIEKLQATTQSLEADLSETRDALEAAQEALAEAEDRIDTIQVQKQVIPQAASRAAARPAKPVASKPVRIARSPSPILQQASGEEPFALSEPTPQKKRPMKQSTPIHKAPDTDYTDPPSLPNKQMKSKSVPAEKQVKVKPVKRAAKSTANKENQGNNIRASKKNQKGYNDFTASPPRSSPPPQSPKRNVKKKPDFSMTPFVDKTNGKSALSLIPLSPPSPRPLSRKADAMMPLNDEPAQPKKKRKLLGGAKTLMDDTPKKVTAKAAKTNFGKELSPLKRPSSGLSSLVLKS